MEEVEDALRRTLADDRRALRGWADPVTRIGAGIVRRRRRRAAAVAAAAILAVVAVGVPTGLRLGLLTAPPPIGVQPSPNDGAVPWIDVPAEPPNRPLARRDPRPDQPPCLGDDLAAPAHALDTGTMDNDRGVQIWLKYVGAETCTVSGPGVVIATDDATGRRATLAINHGTFMDGGVHQYPATVDPGERIAINVATSDVCTTAPIRYRDISVVVAGREVPVGGLVLETQCPLSVGDWYVDPPVLTAPLTARLEVPATVRRGGTLDYTLVLRNDHETLFWVAGCPAYRQTLNAVGKDQWWQLNCEPNDGIAPHQTVRFAMRLTVPPDAPLGPARLTWFAIYANGRVLDADGVTVRVIA